jgi:hypothetical protein
MKNQGPADHPYADGRRLARRKASAELRASPLKRGWAAVGLAFLISPIMTASTVYIGQTFGWFYGLDLFIFIGILAAGVIGWMSERGQSLGARIGVAIAALVTSVITSVFVAEAVYALLSSGF